MATKKTMAAKRRTQQKKTFPYRKLMRAFFGLTLASFIISSIVWSYVKVSDPRTLPIRSVQIEGEFRYLTTGELERIIAPQTNDGFFTVDVEKLQDIVKSIPWVDQVSVRRVWPDTLRFRVIEQVPLARWGDNSLLNTSGQIFTPEKGSLPNDLIILQGPNEQKQVLAMRYQQLQQQLEGTALEITSIALDERLAWQIQFSNKMIVKIGRNNFKSRWNRFVQNYPRVLAREQNKIDSVDLRYANGFAVSWIPGVQEEDVVTQEGKGA